MLQSFDHITRNPFFFCVMVSEGCRATATIGMPHTRIRCQVRCNDPAYLAVAIEFVGYGDERGADNRYFKRRKKDTEG